MPTNKLHFARNKSFAFLCAVVLAMTAGCASVPMTGADKDAEAKAFAAEPGKSAIYIYRNEVFGAAIRMPVTVDGRMLGQTASKTYFRVDVAPGEHEVASVGEDTSRLKLNTVANRIYYIWQEIKMGMFAPRTQLHEVDAATGQKGVNESKRATVEGER